MNTRPSLCYLPELRGHHVQHVSDKRISIWTWRKFLCALRVNKSEVNKNHSRNDKIDKRKRDVPHAWDESRIARQNGDGLSVLYLFLQEKVSVLCDEAPYLDTLVSAMVEVKRGITHCTYMYSTVSSPNIRKIISAKDTKYSASDLQASRLRRLWSSP